MAETYRRFGVSPLLKESRSVVTSGRRELRLANPGKTPIRRPIPRYSIEQMTCSPFSWQTKLKTESRAHQVMSASLPIFLKCLPF
jgi:hypothetical protein